MAALLRIGTEDAAYAYYYYNFDIGQYTIGHNAGGGLEVEFKLPMFACFLFLSVSLSFFFIS